jgi:hypothetical protein
MVRVSPWQDGMSTKDLTRVYTQLRAEIKVWPQAPPPRPLRLQSLHLKIGLINPVIAGLYSLQRALYSLWMNCCFFMSSLNRGARCGFLVSLGHHRYCRHDESI